MEVASVRITFLLLDFSQYTSVEEAAASRQALHGVKWPTTSPKILAVDFADDEEVGMTVVLIINTRAKNERTWLG